MPRIRIELPEHFPFSTSITLLISHINLGRHLDNAQLIGLVSEARVRFLKSMGYTELDVDGAGVIVADAGAIPLRGFPRRNAEHLDGSERLPRLRLRPGVVHA